MEFKITNTKSNWAKIQALGFLSAIIIYVFFVKDLLPKTEREALVYAIIAFGGIAILFRGFYFAFFPRRKIYGFKAYLIGTALLIGGFIKLLLLYNLI